MEALKRLGGKLGGGAMFKRRSGMPSGDGPVVASTAVNIRDVDGQVASAELGGGLMLSGGDGGEDGASANVPASVELLAELERLRAHH
jgi:hypothetical protein